MGSTGLERHRFACARGVALAVLLAGSGLGCDDDVTGASTPTPSPSPTPSCALGGHAVAHPDFAVATQVDGTANRFVDPQAALGAPDGRAVSLGLPDCFLVLDLGEPGIRACAEADLRVIETGAVASYDVFASEQPGGPWTRLGAGVGDAVFELEAGGLSCARYVRLVQTGNDAAAAIAAGSPGSDFDAVHALHVCR